MVVCRADNHSGMERVHTCASGRQLDKCSDDFLNERVRRIHTCQIIQSPERKFYNRKNEKKKRKKSLAHRVIEICIAEYLKIKKEAIYDSEKGS